MNVYDFDNTIYVGDSSLDFYFYCLSKYPSVILRFPKQLCSFLLYKSGKISKEKFKETFFSFVSDLKDPQIEVVRFWNQNEKKIKAWYTLQQKEDDLIISASPRFLLEEICKRINVTKLIATDVDIHTGIFNGKNCYGKEKVNRLYSEFPLCKIDCFYSDSLSDTFLAKLADQAFLVKGNHIYEWEG